MKQTHTQNHPESILGFKKFLKFKMRQTHIQNYLESILDFKNFLKFI